MAKIRVIEEGEILTHCFDEAKDSGVKYKRATAYQKAEWQRKATKMQPGKRGRRDFEFDQNEYNRLLWEECVAEVFGIEGKSGPVSYSKELYRILPADKFDEIAEAVTGGFAEEQNGTDPLARSKTLSTT